MFFTLCYSLVLNFLPQKLIRMKIKFVSEIPQWIISSDVAAYHPASKTIWIRNNLGWKTIPTLLHELTHWFIHKFLGNNEKLHNKLDRKI